MYSAIKSEVTEQRKKEEERRDMEMKTWKRKGRKLQRSHCS